MKKMLRLASLLLLLAVGMGACDSSPPDNGETETSTQAETESETNMGTETETGGNTDMENLIVICGGESEYKFIRPRTMNIATTDVMQDFFDDVKDKTKFNLRNVMYTESESETEKEILMGNVAGRAEAADAYEKLSYSGCRVEIVGEKIVVSAFSDQLLDRALTRLMTALEEDENGNWTLPRDYYYEYDESGVKIAVPVYNTASGELEGVYSAGEGNFEVSVRGTTEAEVNAYADEMKKRGFTLYTENTIGNNKFATYTAKKDGVETAAHTMFYPHDGTFKVVYGVRGYLPETQKLAYPENAVTTPSITQLGRDQVYNGWNAAAKRVDGAPGMGYVIQLADGRYIIIDGGPADGTVTMLTKESGEWAEDGQKTTEDAKKLYDFLVENNPNEGKPVIAAWFITHAHGDHTGLANQFLETYKDNVRVELAGYNFPDLYNTEIVEGGGAAMATNASLFKIRINAFPAAERAKHFVFHTGQKLYFPGCEIEILYTQEDYFPNPYSTGNHTSSVFRITMEAADGSETVFMVMGDTERTNCEEIMATYGAELKCDILQLTHHGFNGACNGIYELMDPDICFWACDPYRYDTDGRCLGTKTNYEFNKWIRDNVDTNYTSEFTTTIKVE
ncbi:MAG: MBL fold metallo-hydrolase [Clostridia bacterium]|nr:MBL fold metallo-hydrolase [Clostridia bacterium]